MREKIMPMILLTRERLSIKEYEATLLEVTTYKTNVEDIVYKSDNTQEVVSIPGMPKCIEYAPTLKLVETVVITKIDNTVIKSTPIHNSDLIKFTVIQPIIIKYVLDIASTPMPIIARLDEGYTFEETLDAIPDKMALKAILALETVDACGFPPLQYALKQSMEEEF